MNTVVSLRIQDRGTADANGSTLDAAKKKKRDLLLI